jgi:hypothetical protein
MASGVGMMALCTSAEAAIRFPRGLMIPEKMEVVGAKGFEFLSEEYKEKGRDDTGLVQDGTCTCILYFGLGDFTHEDT